MAIMQPSSLGNRVGVARYLVLGSIGLLLASGLRCGPTYGSCGSGCSEGCKVTWTWCLDTGTQQGVIGARFYTNTSGTTAKNVCGYRCATTGTTVESYCGSAESVAWKLYDRCVQECYGAPNFTPGLIPFDAIETGWEVGDQETACASSY